jgi:hypothetical protein
MDSLGCWLVLLLCHNLCVISTVELSVFSLDLDLQELTTTNSHKVLNLKCLFIRGAPFFVGLVVLKPLALQLLGATSPSSIDQIFVDL